MKLTDAEWLRELANQMDKAKRISGIVQMSALLVRDISERLRAIADCIEQVR